jgi:hypothetical protein
MKEFATTDNTGLFLEEVHLCRLRRLAASSTSTPPPPQPPPPPSPSSFANRPAAEAAG